MSGNSFGHIFKITTFGESHGKAIGVIIDGCPAGLEITQEEIQKELNRRRPGTSHLTTTRQEKDEVEIFSGVFVDEKTGKQKTTGTPIALVVHNKDQISKPYEKIHNLYRPGHADFTYDAKYGFRDWRGGGRSSARETIARVAAGAIAKKILARAGVKIQGYVTQIGTTKITNHEELQKIFSDSASGSSEAKTKSNSTSAQTQDALIAQIESNPLRCPDPTVLDAMIKEVETARKDLDSVGGIVEVIATGVPAGLGEPVFDKLSAELAHGIMSIPAVKGFEIGDGFASASKRASQNNDPWIKKNNQVANQSPAFDGKPTQEKYSKNTANLRVQNEASTNIHGNHIGTLTNHAGGIIGGISNGEPIVLRFALKPASSIAQKQQTVDKNGKEATIEVHGRHDPCVAARAVPIGEAMVALVLADHLLLNRSSKL